MRILLVDLSSLFRPIWEMAGKEADVDYASKATVARVHSLAAGFDHVAICCDSRKSWRKELASTYKANRPATEEPLRHQLRLAQEQLRDDGFPVWEADGFEADDVIASAVRSLDDGETKIVIASSDKDLFQLVGDRVGVKSLRSGDLHYSDGVQAKLGVRPDQVVDWLCMVGDASDNVEGIKGIGPKRATELLQKHDSLANIYANLGDACHCLGLTPSMYTNLKEGLHTAELARKLITLRTDVELPFADVFKPREAKEEESMETVDGELIDETTGEVTRPIDPTGDAPAAVEHRARVETQMKSTQVVDIAKKKDGAVFDDKLSRALAPVEWSQSLEPQNLAQALNLAKAVFASRQFAAYGTPEAVLLAIMTGRELGISTMAALRSIHIIEGKPTMSAALIAGLVLRSKTCKQFEIIERTNERATIRIWREGWEKPKDITYSVDDAKRAGRVKQGSGWEKNPADMCVARCQAIGGRLGWPDIFANVYLADELGREEAA